MIKTKVFYFIGLLCLTSCDANDNPLAYQKDAHGRGGIKIYIEESYKPLFKTCIYTFEGLFPKAKIRAEYSSERKIIEAFMANKTKTICISRDFTKEEKAYLKSKNVEVRSDKIGLDAIALIVHPSNKDTTLSVDKLKEWISKDGATWPSTKKNVKLVFDTEYSANFNYLLKLTQNKSLSKSVYALKSNEEVIKFVKQNPDALGVIGVNWISDQDDFDVMNFLDSIRVMSVSNRPGEECFQPYAGPIYTQEYPLHREIWLINKGSRAGLNSGFVNFMMGEKGQLLIQKSELVPANAPIRLIHIGGTQ